MTNYTDTQLKQALAEMLPVEVTFIPMKGVLVYHFNNYKQVLDTEFLHLCWLVEETFTPSKRLDYVGELMDNQGLDLWQRYHATWQQRVTALCKVKGIEI